MLSYTRWSDYFGDQVSKLREARTGEISLLHDSEIESMSDMNDALYECYFLGIRPKVAAERYLRWRGELTAKGGTRGK